jgi:hypothetical protein
MLRWTCRLRDVLEAGGFLTDDHGSLYLSEMREAEFISVDGVFPNEFRWESFSSCFHQMGYGYALAMYRNCPDRSSFPVVSLSRAGTDVQVGHIFSAIEPGNSTGHSIRSLCGQPVTDLSKRDIHVLWLSPSVFVSPVAFCIGSCLQDFEVSFMREVGCGPSTERTLAKYFSTSLSSFENGELDEPSSLALHLFRHIFALLPGDYFREVELTRNASCPRRCTLDAILQFLSMLPPRALSQAVTKERWTRFILGGRGSINIDELRVILFHQFHPTVRIQFDSEPFDTSVSLAGMLEFLKGAHALRSIDFPPQLFEGEHAEQGPQLEVAITTSALSMRANGAVPPELLKAISETFRMHSVDIDFSPLFWNNDGKNRQEILSRFVHPFLDGRLKAESLRIRFDYYKNEDILARDEYDLNEVCADKNDRKRVLRWVAGSMISCQSKHLWAFNISILFRDIKKHNYEDVDVNMWWDAYIFPALAVNYCDAKLSKAIPVGVLGLAIEAINRGHIYHRTTGHDPYDMNISNAGLVFHFIKRQVRTRSGFNGWCGDVSPVARGKRSTPSEPDILADTLNTAKKTPLDISDRMVWQE